MMRRVRWPRTRDEWSLIAVSGVLQFTFNYGLVFWGEQHISSGLAAVLQSTFPLFGLVIARFYLPHERITTVKVAGVLLTAVTLSVRYRRKFSYPFVTARGTWRHGAGSAQSQWV